MCEDLVKTHSNTFYPTKTLSNSAIGGLGSTSYLKFNDTRGQSLFRPRSATVGIKKVEQIRPSSREKNSDNDRIMIKVSRGGNFS